MVCVILIFQENILDLGASCWVVQSKDSSADAQGAIREGLLENNVACNFPMNCCHLWKDKMGGSEIEFGGKKNKCN